MNPSPLIIAADPGSRGALVLGHHADNVRTYPFNGTPTGLSVEAWRSIRSIVDGCWVDGSPTYGALEAPVKFRGQSNRTTSATSVVYGQSCGALEFVFSIYLEIPKTHLSSIDPHKWQRALGLGQAGQRDKATWKRYLRDAAQERFPHLKVTLQTADALLIWAWQEQQITAK